MRIVNLESIITNKNSLDGVSFGRDECHIDFAGEVFLIGNTPTILKENIIVLRENSKCFINLRNFDQLYLLDNASGVVFGSGKIHLYNGWFGKCYAYDSNYVNVNSNDRAGYLYAHDRVNVYNLAQDADANFGTIRALRCYFSDAARSIAGRMPAEPADAQ